MSSITYTAKRGLISSHSVDVSYDIEVDMEVIDIKDDSINDIAHKSLDGSVEGVFYAIQTEYRLTTVALGEDTDGGFALMREFIQSVAGSAQFVFDAYGTIASPDNAQTVVLVPGSNRYERINPVPQSSAPTFKVSFTVRVHP